MRHEKRSLSLPLIRANGATKDVSCVLGGDVLRGWCGAHELDQVVVVNAKGTNMSEPRTVGELVDRLPVPRQQQSSAVTPMQMLQIAIERGADVGMLEKLMGLQERWEASEARKAFVTALNAFKAKPPSITKNKHVSFATRDGDRTEYDHATLDQVCDTVGSALSQHGLSHRWDISQSEGLIAVTCILVHEMGHSEQVTLRAGADGSGKKNPIQQIASTVTYLQRYTLLAITGLAASGMDDDGKSTEDFNLITPEQKDELIALLKETNANTAKFLKFMEVEALDAIPASQFPKAKTTLENRREAKP